MVEIQVLSSLRIILTILLLTDMILCSIALLIIARSALFCVLRLIILMIHMLLQLQVMVRIITRAIVVALTLLPFRTMPLLLSLNTAILPFIISYIVIVLIERMTQSQHA